MIFSSMSVRNMRSITTIFLVLFTLPLVMAGEPRKEFLSDFVLGKYLLVGKSADSTSTYFGHVEIYSENETLKVRRKIGSETVQGSARIESADRGGTKVLRVKFDNNGRSYEKTCLIHGDLDNYARISCYLYLSEGETEQPGLEVLFVDHSTSK